MSSCLKKLSSCLKTCLRVHHVNIVRQGFCSRLFYLLILLSPHNAEKSIAMPETQEMAAQAMMPSCCVKPATTNVRNDTAATVRAYGNCEDTW